MLPLVTFRPLHPKGHIKLPLIPLRTSPYNQFFLLQTVQNPIHLGFQNLRRITQICGRKLLRLFALLIPVQNATNQEFIVRQSGYQPLIVNRH